MGKEPHGHLRTESENVVTRQVTRGREKQPRPNVQILRRLHASHWRRNQWRNSSSVQPRHSTSQSSVTFKWSRRPWILCEQLVNTLTRSSGENVNILRRASSIKQGVDWVSELTPRPPGWPAGGSPGCSPTCRPGCWDQWPGLQAGRRRREPEWEDESLCVFKWSQWHTNCWSDTGRTSHNSSERHLLYVQRQR